MKNHVTAVAVLQLGTGVLGFLTACILLFVMLLPGIFVIGLEGEGLPLVILASIGAVVAGMLVIFSLPKIIAGIGLLMWKNWARYLTMVLAVLQLFNIPVGTAIGAYSLWVLLQDETEQLFLEGDA
jgi:hypothetical protein